MTHKKKLIFINTHPIQYFAPLYRQIEQDGTFDLEVWYGTTHGLNNEFDEEFNRKIKWDIPLLEGYKFRFFKNYSWKPGGIYKGYWGIINLGMFKALFSLKRGTVVVVHGWFPFSIAISLICSKLAGNLTCLRAEPPLVHENKTKGLKSWLRKFFLKRILFSCVDRFLYIGTQNKKFYEYFGIKESKLFFTPYAVNNDFFQRNASALSEIKLDFKKSLGIPDTSKVILFSGKLIPKKRPLDLVQSFNQIVRNELLFLIFMGEGELRIEIEQYCKENNLKNVMITGFVNQSQVAQYYSIADIFVMCSDVGETWGLSVNEALNFSVPVIISDKTGCFDDLVCGNGYVTQTGNLNDLSEKLSLLIDSTPSNIHSMQQQSLSIIQNFSYRQIIDGLKQSTI